MQNDRQCFSRNRLSRLDIRIYIMLLVLFIGVIIFTINQQYYGSIIYIVGMGLLIRKLLSIPSKILLTSNHITLGQKQVQWKDILETIFTLGSRDYKDNIVIIKTTKDSMYIHARYYNNQSELLPAIENKCKLHAIKIKEEDWGAR